MAISCRVSSTGVVSGRLRWAVNSTLWEPKDGVDGPEFTFLLSLIQNQSDRDQVGKFRFDADKKRALLSRLLVRQASSVVLGLDTFGSIEIERTKGKKPFLKSPRPDRRDLANFNFNVSHEGDWVVLASEPLCVCGVDVAAPRDARAGARCDIYIDFKDQLSATEWADVRIEGSVPPSSLGDDPEYQAFQRRWSCKEAFTKARGDGLGFEPLSRASFTFEPGISKSLQESKPDFEATVSVDGSRMTRWRFFQQRLGSNHWVTVGRGPSEDIVDAIGNFKATFTRPSSEFSAEDWERELRVPEPAFDEVLIQDLVPFDKREEYARIQGFNLADLYPSALTQPGDATQHLSLLGSSLHLPIGSEETRCSHCGSLAYHQCSRCKLVAFCSAECQRAAWPSHQEVCHATKPQ